MRRAWVAVSAALVLFASAGAALYLETSEGVLSAGPTPTPAPLRSPLLPPGSAGLVPSGRGVERAIAAGVLDAALGTRVSLSIVDALTGEPLLERDSGRAAVPASTAKIVTAVAALTVLGPERRIETRIVQGGAGEVVLVGGGDPTLAGVNASTGFPDEASLAGLAAQLTGSRVTRVLVDDSLFSGPRTGPAWKPTYVTRGNVAPVSALAVDGGRTSSREGSPRTADPALAAGGQLAKLIGATSVARGKAAEGATVLASVESPPVSALVEVMLGRSDNDLAEALGRHVALATRQPASFEGAAAALAAVVPEAAGLRDASGLSPLNRLPVSVLTTLLARAVQEPALAPLLAGLPVSGFTGTLAQRYQKGPEAVAGGQVRAKTGNLTGVTALAGLVRTREGRPLAFAFVADGIGATLPAQRALDRLAAALAACGCP